VHIDGMCTGKIDCPEGLNAGCFPVVLQLAKNDVPVEGRGDEPFGIMEAGVVYSKSMIIECVTDMPDINASMDQHAVISPSAQYVG